MSFEGYYLKKCKNNHIFTFDVYDDDAEDKCLQCNEKFIKTRIVDCTNGLTKKQERKIYSKFKKA
ncbi:MAG: hypothetical protein J6J11_03025 [Treponema sp.]|nr:hypothetical protein [Clostridia bacterium]MBP3607275.1 hypothetical protein [Treponema sp.]